MDLNMNKTSQFLLNSRQEPSRGASSFELAMLTLGVVAVIGLSGLLV